jgi:flagellar motor switch protein FliM
VNAGDALSPEEMQALLAAVHEGSVPVTPGQQAGDRQPAPYDFRRPRRVSKDQIRALTNIHKEFAELLSASLSAMLRTMVDLTVETVEQITYSEYTSSLPITTCAFVFNMEPLKAPAVLELAPRAAFVAIDRLLGGQGQDASVTRDLTEIERIVIERLGGRMLIDLAAAWHGVGKFTRGRCTSRRTRSSSRPPRRRRSPS